MEAKARRDSTDVKRWPERWIRFRKAALAAVALCLLPVTYARSDGSRPPATHALLINGGSRPAANYQSHLHHLQDLVEVLERRGLPRDRIHIFSADGEDEAADLAVRDVRAPGFWLLADTRVGRSLQPRTELTDTRWEGVTLRPARAADLKEWFTTAAKTLEPGDELLIFVTDHGEVNREDLDNGSISLWQEELTVRDFRPLVAGLPSGVRAVMVMSQCYSGTFANAIYADDGAPPSGDICGFFSTKRDLRAYGCYPEGRDRDRLGHAFHFIDALDRGATTADAHLEVLYTDDTPDVPLRTSDLYLERVVSEEAAARDVDVGVLVDGLLREAWSDRARWEPEIRLLDRIGETFGMFSPRSLAELEAYAAELTRLSERMKTFSERWEGTLTAVKEENLGDFVDANGEWRERLAPSALENLEATARDALLAELLPVLRSYTHGRSGQRERLDGLRERTDQASRSRWRLDTRKAGTQRMRAILIGIAGRVLLAEGETASEERPAQRAAYERLTSCEAHEPGELAESARLAPEPAVRPFPPLAHELSLLEEILPSWLGVRFRAVPSALRAGRNLPAGASWLEAVFPDSPATQAGLEAGDILLGPPARHFSANGQLREWTMTSPRDTPLELDVLRPRERAEDDVELVATLKLGPYPLVWPELPGPPLVGDAAPALPSGLEPVGSAELPELDARSRIVFFWATWCKPCRAAVPELLAFAESEGLPVLAITDEELEPVTGYLAARKEAFFEHVLLDPLRKTFRTHGVSGTPTILLVDDHGVIRHRQVGYRPATGLTVDGWEWSPP